MLLVHKALNYYNKSLVPYPNGSLEIQAITIRSNSQDVDVINVYNHRDTLNINEFNHYFTQFNNNYILLGDFNGHHPLWEPAKNPAPNTTGRVIAQLLAENANLCLATPPDLPTYTDPRTGETSTLDLFFCSQQYLGIAEVQMKGCLGSDHDPALVTIGTSPEQQMLGKRPRGLFELGLWGPWLRDVYNTPGLGAQPRRRKPIILLRSW